MAGSFPVAVQYPLRVRYSCLTRVHRATNAAEQRYAVRGPFVEIELTFTNLPFADADSIETFFTSQKGAFDSTWTLSFGGRTYTAMRFDDDTISWSESLPARWSGRLRCSGLLPALTGIPLSFPALTSGAITSRPWARRLAYDTNRNDLESGVRHALAFRAGGLTGFPSGALLGWDLNWSNASEADIDRLVKWFVDRHGRLKTFTFTEPEGGTFADCRFGADTLDVQYAGYNRCTASFQVERP